MREYVDNTECVVCPVLGRLACQNRSCPLGCDVSRYHRIQVHVARTLMTYLSDKCVVGRIRVHAPNFPKLKGAI